MKRLFKQVFACTGLESLIYQLSLISHQLILYHYLDKASYGTIGTLFSLIFLAISLLNVGLDKTIAPFFYLARECKQTFKQLIIMQIVAQLFIIGLMGCLLYVLHTTFTFSLLSVFSTQEITIASCIVISESIRRSCKTVLQLLFYNKFVSILEVSSLLCYIAIVWGLLYAKQDWTYSLFYWPMLLTSVVTTILSAAALMRHYKKLFGKEAVQLPWGAIIKARCINYLYELSHSWYSANFLVPLFASTHGVQMAGFLKIVSMIAHSLNSIITHSFGITAETIFAYIKPQTLAYKRQFFSHISSYLIKTLCMIALILLCHYPIVHLYSSLSADHIYISYLFLLLILSESFILTHERFIILEQRTWFLVICNMITSIPFWFAPYMMYHTLHATSLLYLLLASRGCCFLAIFAYVYYHWHIRISWHTQTTTSEPALSDS